MFWTIDRIENEIAVVETDSGRIDIPLCCLPKGSKEGSVIALEISASEENRRRENISKKVNRLFCD